MQIIDSHQHFWMYNQEEFDWLDDSMAMLRRDFLPQDLEPELQANNVQGCIAVQAPQTHAENDFLLSLADQHPFILGVVGWVDLRASDLEKHLARFADHPKFVGVRNITQGQPAGTLTDPAFINGVNQLHKYGLTYDLLIYENQLPEALEFVAQVNDSQPIVLDHIAKPNIKENSFDAWATHIKNLAQHPNVSCKLSGMSFEADWQSWIPETLKPYIHHTINCFTPDRCMFGSDWPVSLPPGTYQQTLNALKQNLTHLTPSEQEKILSQSSRNFYNLSP